MKVKATVSDLINVLQQVEARCGKDTPVIVNEIMGDLHPLFNVYLDNNEGNDQAQVLLEFDREDVHPTINKRVNVFSQSGKFFVKDQIQVTKIYKVSDDESVFEPMGEYQFIEFAKGRINDIDFTGINTWMENEQVERLEHLADNKQDITLDDALVICDALYYDISVEEIY